MRFHDFIIKVSWPIKEQPEPALISNRATDPLSFVDIESLTLFGCFRGLNSSSLFSSYGPPIFSNLKSTNDIRFRYCLFSTDYHLVKKMRQNYINLDDLRPLFSDLNFCIYKKAIFINEEEVDDDDDDDDGGNEREI